MTSATSRATTDGIVGAQRAMLVGEDPSGEVYIHTREQSTERGPLSCAVRGRAFRRPHAPAPPRHGRHRPRLPETLARS